MLTQLTSPVAVVLVPRGRGTKYRRFSAIMRKFSLQDNLGSLESLERKVSLSSLAFVGAGRPSHVLPVMVRPLDDDPPPDPEPAPPVNPINGPLQYPTLPPSGPLGPG